MSTRTTRRKRKTTSSPSKEIKKAQQTKKKCIDMNYIPESLKREGYDPSFQEEEIPTYLKCPTCKELFVNPEMYNCGHTLCKICIEQRHNSQCPICKQSCFTQPIPNYILKELIEQQFPNQQEKRVKELNEMQGLREKLLNYQRSTRFKNLFNSFTECLSKHVYPHLNVVVKFLRSLKEIEPPVSEDEARFFLSSILVRTYEIGVIGEHIIDKKGGVDTLVTWLEKKKTHNNEHKKWVPLILMCMTPNRTYPFDLYQKLAKIYKVDIGNELPFEEWRGKPAFWLKDIDLEISDFYLNTAFDSDSDCDSEEEFSSDYYSDSISDF